MHESGSPPTNGWPDHACNIVSSSRSIKAPRFVKSVDSASYSTGRYPQTYGGKQPSATHRVDEGDVFGEPIRVPQRAKRTIHAELDILGARQEQ